MSDSVERAVLGPTESAHHLCFKYLYSGYLESLVHERVNADSIPRKLHDRIVCEKSRMTFRHY
jgi:hypothetical protein